MTQTKSRPWFRRASLSTKLLLVTWAVSTFAALILTGIQLVFNYHSDLKTLEESYGIIERTYLDSLAENMWSFDNGMTELQLDGLSRLQGVSYVRLSVNDKVLYMSGNAQRNIQSYKIFPIIHQSTQQVLGTLEVELDVASLQSRYLKESIWIFGRQALSMLFVVLCLYIIFNYTLISHIQDIARYLTNTDERNSHELRLRHRWNYASSDELGILVQSINSFRTDQINANERLGELNAVLERKVSTRTQELTTKNQSLEKAMMQIKRMQATLVAQERLTSLGSLTANVAHEIRNPLNFVINFSQLLLETENRDESIELSRMILKHSKRIDQIIRSMQILSGDDDEPRASEDIGQLVKQAAEEIRLLHSKEPGTNQIRFVYEFEDNTMLPVYGKSLSRAIMNMVDNSIHSLHDKLKALPSFQPEIKLKTAIHEDTLEIVIHDNGLGIAAVLGENIFDPFLSTKPMGEGAGLGLTVAFNIAQKHGGNLRYRSESGNWTEFILSIPLFAERVS